MSSWNGAIRGLLFVTLLFAVGSGCDDKQSEESQDRESSATADSTRSKDDDPAVSEKTKAEAVSVDVALLSRGSIESVIRSTANLEAESKIVVQAEASRRVTGLFVEEGIRVSKGELLLRLQDSEQRSVLRSSEFNLARAERESKRQKSLNDRDLTTKQVYLDAQEEFERLRLKVDDARRELSYTEVKAPISGTITNRYVSVGDQVQPGQQLFDIVDFKSLVALIYVPEKNLKDLRVGQTVRLTSTSVRKEPFVVKVKRIAPIVDPRSGTIKVTVDVGGQNGLRPGLFVEVALVTAVYDEALLLPKRALVYDNDQIFVYRLAKNRRAERLLVLPQLSNKEYVMPVSGFAVGDTIIIAGQAGLKDGAHVELVSDRPEDSTTTDAGENELVQEATSG